MPHLIYSAAFARKLDLLEANIGATQHFLLQHPQEMILPGWDTPHGYCLFVSREGLQYRLVCDTQTVYLLELRLRTDIIVGKQSSTEVMLWRTNEGSHQHAVQGLAHRFFEFILNRYTIAVTDEQQTSDGRNFWTRQISWALGRKYSVYVSDGGEENRPLTPVTDFQEYNREWVDFCYGENPELYRHRLIVISKEPL